jgi:regulator of cell morphogenesis and NO signaling
MREGIPSEGDSIRDFFRTDHERLDRAFDEFCRVRRNGLVLARPAFDEFVSRLERHFRWEEEVLFAVFEAAEPDGASAPTIVMRAEHRKIEEALHRLGDRVRAADPDCDEEEACLLELLEAHHFKEERVVYPMADRMLDATARKALLRRLTSAAAALRQT